MKNFPALLTGIRRFFYAVTPDETSFATVEEVPNYIQEVINAALPHTNLMCEHTRSQIYD